MAFQNKFFIPVMNNFKKWELFSSDQLSLVAANLVVGFGVAPLQQVFIIN